MVIISIQLVQLNSDKYDKNINPTVLPAKSDSDDMFCLQS